jgi:hypothetical protein
MQEPREETTLEQDILVSRLVARISELEERLYKKELESPPSAGIHACMHACISLSAPKNHCQAKADDHEGWKEEGMMMRVGRRR